MEHCGLEALPPSVLQMCQWQAHLSQSNSHSEDSGTGRDLALLLTRSHTPRRADILFLSTS